MGPPSDNGGYDLVKDHKAQDAKALQWVHRPITVVMTIDRVLIAADAQASMGPPSDNGGYAEVRLPAWTSPSASMGPPSDNGGYGR